MDYEDDKSEEEEFQYQPHPQLELAFQKEGKYECQTLVVGQFGPASLFLHSTIGQTALSNRVNFSKAKQSSLADLYLDSDKTGYLLFNDELPPMREIHLLKFLSKNIAFERLTLVMSVPRTTLETASCPSLTYISTSDLEKTLTLPKFPQGITGIWAELLAWGEVSKVPVSGFVVAMSEYELTNDILSESFAGLRGKYGLKDTCSDVSEKVRKYNIKKSSNKMYL